MPGTAPGHVGALTSFVVSASSSHTGPASFLLESLGQAVGAVANSVSGAAGAVKGAVQSGLGGGQAGAEEEEDPTAGKEERVACNWHDLELGNNTNIWKQEKADIKYAYDHDLKGHEVTVWWPGRAKKGECNNLKDANRGCWYNVRMLNDVGCRSEGRCLHFAAHDGEPNHTYTCPTWVRNDGRPCKLPPNWQDCPPSFVLKRVDTGVPQNFRKATSQQCARTADELEEMRKTAAQNGTDSGAAEAEAAKAMEGPTDHCSGSTKGIDDVNMIFDIRHNAWYRCGQNFKCEPWDIRKIKEPAEGACGEGDDAKVCEEGEFCFVHRVTSKRSTYECMNGKKVFLLSEDGVAKFAAPPVAPPQAPLRQRRRHGWASAKKTRRQQQGLFL